MKKRSWILKSFCCTLLLLAIPCKGLTQPLGEHETYMGETTEGQSKSVTIILEKHDPNSYTVVGRLYFPGVFAFCSITGTYFSNTRALKAKAACEQIDIVVNGTMSDDGSSISTVIDDTIHNVRVFSGSLLRVNPTPEETAGQNVATTAEPLTIGGISPSPPDVHEEWNGQWKGKAKTTQTTDGIAPVTREQDFTFQVINDGLYVRIIGDRELKYKLTYSNPNAALMVVEKEEPAVLGTAASKEKVVVFLRDGRFYMQRLFKVTATYQDSTTNAVTDTITIAERVK